MKNSSYIDVDLSSQEVVSIIREDAKSFKTCHLCEENKPHMMFSFIATKLDHVERDFGDYAAFIGVSAISALSLLVRGRSKVITQIPGDRFHKVVPLHLGVCKECIKKKTNSKGNLIFKASDYKKHPLYQKAKKLGYKNIMFQDEFTLDDLQGKSFQKDLLKIRKLVKEMENAIAPTNNDVLVSKNIEMSQKTYDEYGFDKEGYNREGYDAYGYDREGFNREGWNRKGYDRNGYDENGFNVKGYDEDGFNKDGYNVEGFDRKGFNSDGWNKSGINKKTGTEFDENGLDKDGFNSLGFNSEGINKITKTKYGENGYDKDGYDKDGYDKNGKDKNGKYRDKKARIEARKYRFLDILSGIIITIGIILFVGCIICCFEGPREGGIILFILSFSLFILGGAIAGSVDNHNS